MITLCADLIRERIKELEENKLGLDWLRKQELEELLPQIESLEAQSVENMMEEMPVDFELNKNSGFLGRKSYSANYCTDDLEFCWQGRGNTPSEALQELKKKLNQ